jgi:hypothetical protein
MKKFKVRWIEQQEWECIIEAESRSDAVNKWNGGESVSPPVETNWHCIETDSVEAFEIEDEDSEEEQ